LHLDSSAILTSEMLPPYDSTSFIYLSDAGLGSCLFPN
jgi:hypothetical protein